MFNQHEDSVQHQDLPAIALGGSEGVGSGIVEVCSAIARLKGASNMTIIVPASWQMLSGATLTAVGMAQQTGQLSTSPGYNGRGKVIKVIVVQAAVGVAAGNPPCLRVVQVELCRSHRPGRICRPALG